MLCLCMLSQIKGLVDLPYFPFDSCLSARAELYFLSAHGLLFSRSVWGNFKNKLTLFKINALCRFPFFEQPLIACLNGITKIYGRGVLCSVANASHPGQSL